MFNFCFREADLEHGVTYLRAMCFLGDHDQE